MLSYIILELNRILFHYFGFTVGNKWLMLCALILKALKMNESPCTAKLYPHELKLIKIFMQLLFLNKNNR